MGGLHVCGEWASREAQDRLWPRGQLWGRPLDRKDGFAQTEDLGPSASPTAPRKLRLPTTGAFPASQHGGRLARAFKVTSEHQLLGGQIDRRNITLFP